MATTFTQDTVLHYLRSSGGSVKNSDLLLHFRNFIRDHSDQVRNRELFKKFVNSVATVQQLDGVSYVVLRRKFKGYVPAGGEEGSPGPLRLPAGRNTEPSTESTTLSPAGGAETPRLREETAPAPPGVTAGKTALPAAGIILNNNNNVETNLNLKQEQVNSTREVSGRPEAAQDDSEEAESSEGSTSTPVLRQPLTVARQLSSQLRSRMCRSLGADLDQLLQEEAGGGGGGSEAARLNRLHLISSSLSLRYNLSSSSLSSCSTPPRCHSLADLVEGGREGKGGRRSLPTGSSSAAHHEVPNRQSLVPLDPKEHAWLVKGAAGAWPDIYSLFREDSSLLNRRDFISGFTVLHWIAKHGDHRVLNTLWYGVEKAGMTFDINARSASGHTPLHIAAIHGHKNIMRLLVSKFNADVKLRDTAGKKPWQYLNRTTSSDVFQLLGAPARAVLRGEGTVEKDDSSLRPEQPRRRRRHHFSTASGQRPVTVAGMVKVKRSSSIAALLKHKSMRRFYGHQSDSSV
ncbi:Ankyrin repeat domain-containing protein SOWAHB [Collichthys lucidus]|uniref:Ankyrin repeat domain-containing protein SOWAHB n=1 Tax=Collichthys lucidus TaxID=240159 RepID=A0A4U5V9F1_COLLU|nr:Ankyrin repeat domain-containing protein SOWAHB [Collichthys lucidus]